jgi:hypothetical protein
VDGPGGDPALHAAAHPGDTSGAAPGARSPPRPAGPPKRHAAPAAPAAAAAPEPAAAGEAAAATQEQEKVAAKKALAKVRAPTPADARLPSRVIFPWPAGSTRYHVYEVLPPDAEPPDVPPGAEQPYPRRLTPDALQGTTFTDTRLDYGTERCYAVRTVETVGTTARRERGVGAGLHHGPGRVPAHDRRGRSRRLRATARSASSGTPVPSPTSRDTSFSAPSRPGRRSSRLRPRRSGRPRSVTRT